MENSFANYMLQKLDCQVVFKEKQEHQLALVEQRKSPVQ
jgi:hypothetical protein